MTPQLEGKLKLLCRDLTAQGNALPCADLQVRPRYVSCGIQINTGEEFVSDSPYLHVFDCLKEVHHQMEPQALTEAMEAVGYPLIFREDMPLPNGKALVCLDFEKAEV